MPKWLNRVRKTLKNKTRSGRRKLQNLMYKARRAVSTKKQREKLLEKRFETLKRRMAKNNPNWERNYKENQDRRALARRNINRSQANLENREAARMEAEEAAARAEANVYSGARMLARGVRHEPIYGLRGGPAPPAANVLGNNYRWSGPPTAPAPAPAPGVFGSNNNAPGVFGSNNNW